MHGPYDLRLVRHLALDFGTDLLADFSERGIQAGFDSSQNLLDEPVEVFAGDVIEHLQNFTERTHDCLDQFSHHLVNSLEDLLLYIIPAVQNSVDLRDGSIDEDENTVQYSNDRFTGKKRRRNGDVTRKEWIQNKKQKMRAKGKEVTADSKYTARKRKPKF